MLFFQGVVHIALLAGVAFGTTCKTPPSSCKSISTQKAVSSSCSRVFTSNGVKISTCTNTVTKAAATTTKYVGKGKYTCTEWKTSTTTKTVKTACKTVTLPKTTTKTTHKTITRTSTKVSSVKAVSTSLCTTTKTVTKTTTITGSAPKTAGYSYYNLLKRGGYVIPKPCSCFATKTKTTTKSISRTTKTVNYPTSLATKWNTKKVTDTKTVAVAQLTKYTTKTSTKTSTHYKTTTKTLKNTSTSVVRSTKTSTKTAWVTKYVSPGKTTTVYRLGSARTTTVFPAQSTGIVSVIIYKPQAIKTVTKIGASHYTLTLFPTNSAGSTITDLSGTKTVEIFITRSTTSITRVGTKPGTRRDTPKALTAPVTFITWKYQSTTTLTSFGSSAYLTTLYPSSGGKAITTQFTVTVIDYVTQKFVTVTALATGTVEYQTTVFPSSGGKPITDGSAVGTVINFVTLPIVTVTSPAPGSVPFTTTLLPTDGSGKPLTNGQGTKTAVVYVPQPSVTVTRAATGGPSKTTVFPTDSNGQTIRDGEHTVTVIDYVPLPFVTITRVGTVASTKTVWPTDSNGNTISDGSGTRTVIDYIPQPTVTVIKVGSSVYTTTQFPNPTDISGTISVIDFVTQPVTTIRSLASTESATTIFPAPTDTTGTITVIQYFTQPITTITVGATGGPSTTTLSPTNGNGQVITDGSGTVTVIDFEPRSTTTITSPAGPGGPSATTVFPASNADLTSPVEVITYVARLTTTITSPAGAGGPSATTVFPADPTQPATVITYAARPFTTITSPAGPGGPSATTIIPTNPAQTATVITYANRPVTTITSPGTFASTTTKFPPDGAPVTVPVSVIVYLPEPATTIFTEGPVFGTTTFFPTDSNGSTITDGSGTITVVITTPGPNTGVVTVFPSATTTLTTLGPSGGTTTKFPTNSLGSTLTDGSGTLTIVVTQAITTVIRMGSSVYTTTQYPTNAAGSTITDGSGTITVVDYVVQPITTITKTGTGRYETTEYPTDAVGSTITDLSGTITVIDFVPQITTTIRMIGPSQYTTTQYPTNSAGSTITDGTGTVTVIDFNVQPVITLTSLASTTGLTTQYPTDSSGSTITDGSGTETVITFITQPQTLITEIASTTGLTTLYPTDSAGHTISDGTGTRTIITFVLQPVTTLTTIGSSAYTTTVFPTDSSGSTITGPSGTITVIDYETNPVTTVILPATGTGESSTTIYPASTIPPGTISVIYYLERPVTTVTVITTTVSSTTIFPSNTSNPTSPPISVIIYTTQPAVTITSVASTTGLTTQYPTDSSGNTITDGSGTQTIITFVTPKITTVTSLASTTGLTTLFPTNSVGSTVTDGTFGTETIVTFITQAQTLITRFASTTGLTTEFPIDSAGSTLTNGEGTVTVITFQTPAATTITSVAETTGLTTIFPTNSNGSPVTDGSGTKTIITFILAPVTTVTRVASTTGLTTLFPTDSNGSTITDGSGTQTVVTFKTPAITTLTSLASTTGLTTIFPVNSAGSTVTDGSFGTETIITYITYPQTLITQLASTTGETTVYPTNSAGSSITDGSVPRTIITFITQPYTTITLVGSSVYETTLFPTNSMGSTITDGSDTITVIDYTVPQFVTVTSVTTGSPTTTTVFPPSQDISGTGTVIDYVTQARITTTLPLTGTETAARTTTIFPNPTDITGTVSVIDYEPVPTPDTSCDNAGLQVAIYDNPYVNVSGVVVSGWNPDVFKTVTPLETKSTNMIGFDSSSTSQPYGLNTSSSTYVLNQRGFFYAPYTQIYTFTLSNVDDVVQIWISDKARIDWDSTNPDLSIFSTDTISSKTFSVQLSAGTYLPIRIMYGNGGGLGSFTLTVQDANGVNYLSHLANSPYFVSATCSNDQANFPDFGTETDTPPRDCSNIGLQVAIYDNPYVNNNALNIDGYNVAYFATQQPYGINTTDIVGVPSPGATPQGFYPKVIYDYTMQYRGYFYAPVPSTYTFYVSQINDIVCLWLGQKALVGFNEANADDCGVYVRGIGAANFTFQYTVTEPGTYVPIRIQHADGGNGGSFQINVMDSNNVYYVRDLESSPYLVFQSCDGTSAPSFPPWGAETLNPDTTCNNIGVQVAMYGDPFQDATNNNAAFQPQYFKTVQPQDTRGTQSIGLAWTAGGNNTATLMPYGMTPEIAGNFTLNYRGYFFAPNTTTYTFNITNGRHWSGIWLGQDAYTAWNRANVNATSIYNPTSTMSTNGLVSVALTAGTYYPFRVMIGSWVQPIQFTLEIYDAYGLYYLQLGQNSQYLIMQPCDPSDGPTFPAFGQENVNTPVTTVNLLGPSASTTTIYPTNSVGSTITDGSGTISVVKYNTQAYTTVTLGAQSSYAVTVLPTDSAGHTITDGTATGTVFEHLVPSFTGNPGPAITCNPLGYIINDGDLYSMNLSTSSLSLIKASFDAGVNVNAIGYNVLDNYLYAFDSNDWLVRINKQGTVQRIKQIASLDGGILGDIDGNGQYWISGGSGTSGVSQWAQLNLNPYSGTYAAIVASGTASNTAVGGFADWVYIPDGGNFLYSAAQTSGGYVQLVRFSMTTHQWSVVKNWPSVMIAGSAGSQFGDANGDLYFKINTNGQIWKLNIFSLTTPVFITNGGAVSSTDGARCVFYANADIPLEYTTITLGGTSSTTTTLYPTDSSGATVTSGHRTATVVVNTVPTESGGPTFSCSEFGYVIANSNLYQVNLTTSGTTLITSNFDGGASVNSIGYNVLDNYIYGLEIDTGKVLRIGSDGTITPIRTFANLTGWNVGDVDGNGQYWVSTAGTGWAHIDLKPGSSTFGRTIASGNSTLTGYRVADWVSVPSAGPYLWTIAYVGGSTGPCALAQWSTSTNAWTIVNIFTGFNLGPFGAVYADTNGDLYATENVSGNTYKTNVFTQATPVIVSTAQNATNADGARCVYGSFYPDDHTGGVQYF
ncbi:hypothetical protein AA313_de0203387 [Arthrobotrys entomopaga]|nr:hypothetical protein AA313_de0203387 [Arthrobotrys entomopaga]